MKKQSQSVRCPDTSTPTPNAGRISIEVWPGDDLDDKMEIIGHCYQAVTDLIAGDDLQHRQKDNVSLLLGLLCEIHQSISEAMREQNRQQAGGGND